LKGLLKGFWWPIRSLKSVKYSQSYGPNKVCDSREESMPSKGALLLERRWITREVVTIYVDCGECKGKGVQTHENQG